MFYDSPVMPYILMAVLLSMPIGGAVGYEAGATKVFGHFHDRMPNRAPEFTGMVISSWIRTVTLHS